MSNIDKSVYVATGAIITGDVTIAEDCSIWYNAVIRGDEYPITIGSRSNIQDNAVVHVGAGHSCIIGQNVTVGHGAIVHGCTVGDDTLIGMGAIILNGARIGKNCIIGAGALVSEGKEIPDRTFEEAAQLAAHYSKAEGAAKVEVDYVQRKQIKKPAGSKPGYVIYHTNYSMSASTDISALQEL